MTMTDAPGSRQRAVLEDMLRRLLVEQAASCGVDEEKAQHLADAVIDLRTLIARLEPPAAGQAPQLIRGGTSVLSPARQPRLSLISRQTAPGCLAANKSAPANE